MCDHQPFGDGKRIIMSKITLMILFSASELVTEDGLSPTFIEYIEGTR